MSDYKPLGVHKTTGNIAPRALARLKEIFAPLGASYTKDESNARFERVGTAFTKTESDARYPAKGDVYTTVESDELLALKADRDDIKEFRVFGVSPKDFGAKADGVNDDSPAIANAINTGNQRIILIDANYTMKSLVTITRPDVIILGLGYTLLIPANVNAFNILANNVWFDSVKTDGGNIVYNYGPIDAKLDNRGQGNTGGKLTNNAGIAPKEYIRINYCRNMEITGNRATSVREFGITVWGGDANPGSVNFPGVGVYHAGDIVITGNAFRGNGMAASNGTTAGIWGCCISRVTVTGNNVSEFTDVGIDFEGAINCTATGNTAVNCGNAGYAVFYASRNCVFTGNTYERTGATTFLGHAFLFANTGGSYSNINVSDNTFLGGGIILSDSNPDKRDAYITITGNSVQSGVIALTRVDYAVIENNAVYGGNIALFGGYMGRIGNNQVWATGNGERPIKHVAASFGHNDNNRAGVGAVIFGNTCINGPGISSGSILMDTIGGIGKRGFVVNNIVSVEPDILNDGSSNKGSNYVRGIF